MLIITYFKQQFFLKQKYTGVSSHQYFTNIYEIPALYQVHVGELIRKSFGWTENLRIPKPEESLMVTLHTLYPARHLCPCAATSLVGGQSAPTLPVPEVGYSPTGVDACLGYTELAWLKSY